jgi:general secretion pathway protein G
MMTNPRPTTRQRRGQRGVTLLEILIVLVILGLLATLGTRQVMSYLGRAKADTARLQIRELVAAVDMFRLDVGRAPSTAEGLGSLVEAPGIEHWRGPYLTKRSLLADPWGKPWSYAASNAKQFEIRSLGADDAVGGAADDADISSNDDK